MQEISCVRRHIANLHTDAVIVRPVGPLEPLWVNATVSDEVRPAISIRLPNQVSSTSPLCGEFIIWLFTKSITEPSPKTGYCYTAHADRKMVS